MHYDCSFIGAGLFSATIANSAVISGKKCLVIEKSPHIKVQSLFKLSCGKL